LWLCVLGRQLLFIALTFTFAPQQHQTLETQQKLVISMSIMASSKGETANIVTAKSGQQSQISPSRNKLLDQLLITVNDLRESIFEVQNQNETLQKNVSDLQHENATLREDLTILQKFPESVSPSLTHSLLNYEGESIDEIY
jgi:uncharacterized protein YlxW (UPF0749 family)